MHRHQSRQSQLLNITKWLRNTSNNKQCYNFLEELKNELNHESIGSLIASLIVKNPSTFSNQNINNLSIFCQSNARAKSAESAKTKYSLLSLSNDCFAHLGQYLLRHDGISLGSCCHRLYQATQTVSFLSNVGYGEMWLGGDDIEKIYDCKVDPWMHFVNGKYLTLGHSSDNTSIDMLKKIMQSPYYTNWFGKLMFGHLECLTISGNGGQLLSCLPNWVDLVFGSQRTNQHINTTPLALIFECISSGENGIDLFFHDYSKYFTTKSNDELDNMRKMWSLSCDNSSFSALSDNIGNILQPNYQCFRGSGTLTIDSLKKFCNLFHKNLIQLEMEVLQLDEYSLMNEIYQILFQQGYIFSLSNFMLSDECKDLQILTNDEIEFIRNDQLLTDKMDEIDDELAAPNGDDRDLNKVFQLIDGGKYLYDLDNTDRDIHDEIVMDRLRFDYHVHGNSRYLSRVLRGNGFLD